MMHRHRQKYFGGQSMCVSSVAAEIEKYVPVDEQESKDKLTILKYVKEFPNILTRDNEYAHITSSGWIVNPARSKVLLIYHNIYKSWTWTGGHADGESDLVGVALREANEETGAICRTVSTNIVCLDVLPVWGHFKKGVWVSTHLHLSVAYLLEADDEAEIRIKEDENSGVRWVPVKEVVDLCSESEPAMRYVYEKLMRRVASEKQVESH
jgi:8-oxo-dGTP pyrophosphatase MutT (NUDIX family)